MVRDALKVIPETRVSISWNVVFGRASILMAGGLRVRARRVGGSNICLSLLFKRGDR